MPPLKQFLNKKTRHCAGFSHLAAASEKVDALFSALLNEFGEEARPARLVVCAQSGPVIAVKILVEQQQVAPVRVILERRDFSVDCPLN